MRIAYLTAGAAGMYCGSCMHDNALARQLQKQGVDCVLIPVYTPIRTDEKDVSSPQIFFGGVNVYLLQQLPWLRYFPRGLRRWMDAPRFLSWATRGAGSTSPRLLGKLTVSMLQGLAGRQRDEVQRLANWLGRDLKPDCVLLSNLLIGGAIPAICRACPEASVLVTLQGDDIFIDHLQPPYRQQVIDQMRGLVAFVDRFVVHSQFYADKMGQLLKIPPEKISVLPLAIDAAPFALQTAASNPESKYSKTDHLNIGYLARLAPEKGLHHLVDAFLDLSKREGNHAARLHIAGWQGQEHTPYVEQLVKRLKDAALLDRVQFHGSPDLAGKCEFLKQLSILCVPTDYHDPKGLFVLEAWAAGVPVVQPDHGAFRELITRSGGGLLVPPGDSRALADQLHRLLGDAPQRERLGTAGQKYVRENATIAHQAAKLLELIKK